MNSPVSALRALPNGDLLAAGAFDMAGGVSCNSIARWDGVAWSPLGSGLNWPVEAITRLPNGDIVVGGWFWTAGGVSANRVARWDGASWSPLGPGRLATFVYAPAAMSNGDIVAGGYFSYPNHVARGDGTAGLASASGSSVPCGPSWSWRTGTTQLSVLHPAGGPGCTLLLHSDTTQWLFPSNGSVTTQVVIPNIAALAGVVIRHQVLQAELDASLNLTSLTSRTRWR